jgi:hypothetical protein
LAQQKGSLAELRFLLLFLEKEEFHISNFLGARPQTPVVPLRGRFGSNDIFCEAEQLFLLLFLENEENQ